MSHLYLARTVFLVATVALFANVIVGQECVPHSKRSEIGTQELKATESSNTEGWKRIDFPNVVSLKVPSSFTSTGVKYIREDEKRHILTSDEFDVYADLSNAAYTPSPLTSSITDYCEWISWIDGAYAYFWNLRDPEASSVYESGIHFQFSNDRNYKLSIWVLSSTSETKGIAESIFKSVEFLSSPSKRKK